MHPSARCVLPQAPPGVLATGARGVGAGSYTSFVLLPEPAAAQPPPSPPPPAWTPGGPTSPASSATIASATGTHLTNWCSTELRCRMVLLQERVAESTSGAMQQALLLFARAALVALGSLMLLL
jgi:hypothetical protein